MVNCSIVTYKHTEKEITSLLDCIFQSDINRVYVVDNSPTNKLKTLESYSNQVVYIFNNSNVGYGIAHNIAIKKSIEMSANYHVVINPDISFEKGLLDQLVQVMEEHRDYGQLMPKVTYQNGELQYLCRLIPTPWDYICKRYLPFGWAKKRANKFMLKFTGYEIPMNVPILSGCFMFFRVDALREVGLFDERFFMYPEDDDITRRMHMKYKTMYYPFLHVFHGYEAAPYKNLRMHFVLLKNMIKYFNKWGWIFDKNRHKVNKQVLEELNYKVHK